MYVPKRGEPWLRERLATLGDDTAATTALQMTAAAFALLWPEALAGGPYAGLKP